MHNLQNTSFYHQHNMSTALFTSGSSSLDSSRNIIEFKAGKMFMRGKMVHPDKRKGLFYVHREKSNMLTHVCWKDRTSGKVEDDLIVFPDDCEFKRVDKCTTGRVYLLLFKSSNKKLFFWMQESKTDKDAEYEKKVNSVLNDQTESENDILEGTNLSQLVGSGQQEELLQRIFQSHGMFNAPSTRSLETTNSSNNGSVSDKKSEPSTLPTTNATPTTHQLQISDLNKIMSSMASTQPTRASVDLAAGITTDILSSLLESEEARERLIRHLPTDGLMPPETDDLEQSLRSPQYRQALSKFSMAFNSGQLGPLISQFNLGEEAVTAANNSDLKAFIKALEKKIKDERMDTD